MVRSKANTPDPDFSRDPLRRTLTVGAVLLFLVLGFGGCATQAAMENLRLQMERLQSVWLKEGQSYRELRSEMLERIEWVADQTPACKYRSEARRLAASCHDMTCNSSGLNEALEGLRDMKGGYVVAYLRPSEGAEDITGERKQQIRELLLDRQPNQYTRWLLLVLPSADTQADRDHAGKIAKDLKQLIDIRFLDKISIRNIAAQHVTCDSSSRGAFNHFIQRDLPRGREPRTKAMVVLIMRLDCT